MRIEAAEFSTQLRGTFWEIESAPLAAASKASHHVRNDATIRLVRVMVRWTPLTQSGHWPLLVEWQFGFQGGLGKLVAI
jgi:hypothetical protein